MRKRCNSLMQKSEQQQHGRLVSIVDVDCSIDQGGWPQGGGICGSEANDSLAQCPRQGRRNTQLKAEGVGSLYQFWKARWPECGQWCCSVSPAFSAPPPCSRKMRRREALQQFGRCPGHKFDACPVVHRCAMFFCVEMNGTETTPICRLATILVCGQARSICDLWPLSSR